MIAYEGRCFYCKRALCYREATTDHFIPRSRGGANSTANRVLACTDCNTAKRDLDPRTFGLETPDESTDHDRELMQRLRQQIILRQLSNLGVHTQAPPKRVLKSLLRASASGGTEEEPVDEGNGDAEDASPEPVFKVWQIEERLGQRKPLWREVGAAFPAKNGKGYDLKLRAIPISGRLYLGPPAEAANDEAGET
ncbi:MAG: HNH endonuclease [Sphingomonadales bacterium]|nr:HNH endonuclease [Sphingomonadales bacterium]